jgi:C_GCAxxG_C_C family probable redox protein
MRAMKRSRKSSNSPVELAVTRFAQGFNCSQSVFSAFCPGKRIPAAVALSIASPFGAGVGRTGSLCGAVTGGIMAIGLRYGHTNARDQKKKEAVYRMTRKFVDRFLARNGTIICNELLECDLGTPEGRKTAEVNDYHHTRCPKFVRDATEIILKFEGRQNV